MARALAAALNLPHLELDAIFHQADWQPLDGDIFVERVSVFTSAPGWIVDGNYSAVRDLVWDRADTVIWLDLPRYPTRRTGTWPSSGFVPRSKSPRSCAARRTNEPARPG